MIAAFEAEEYALIVTKSVSHFARNLVDCVSLARKLKNQNPLMVSDAPFSQRVRTLP